MKDSSKLLYTALVGLSSLMYVFYFSIIWIYHGCILLFYSDGHWIILNFGNYKKIVMK